MASDTRGRVEAEEVESRILGFLRDELLGKEVEVSRDDDLLTGEILDSVGALRLAGFVGDEFDIEMQPADFVIENFQTVAALAAYVVRASARSVRAPNGAGR